MPDPADTAPDPACDPQCGAHPRPARYVAHSVWAEEMLKTHDQYQCLGCGLWSIWELKTEESDRHA